MPKERGDCAYIFGEPTFTKDCLFKSVGYEFSVRSFFVFDGLFFFGGMVLIFTRDSRIY
jgi:hypothetical protein